MKKILFACDGRNFSPALIRFAADYNQVETILLTGVFFHTINYTQLAASTMGMDSAAVISLTLDEEQKDIDQSIRLFESACTSHGIEHRVHDNSADWSADSLLKESRFADLLLLSEELFYASLDDRQPNSAMREILHKSECPVLLLPENYTEPAALVIAYDGRRESVFAIKQFASLLPHYCQKECSIVYISDDDDEIPDIDLLKELAARHFPQLEISHYDFDARKYFETWIRDKKGVMLIAGAFGRSFLSMSFKKSFVSGIIKEHQAPVFVGHH
jgi:hypothetical protein